MPATMHKPESLHYARCPKCLKIRICVLAYPNGDKTLTRCYYIRNHACGRRLDPVPLSLKELS